MGCKWQKQGYLKDCNDLQYLINWTYINKLKEGESKTQQQKYTRCFFQLESNQFTTDKEE